MDRTQVLLLVLAVGLILGGVGLAWEGVFLVTTLVADATWLSSVPYCTPGPFCRIQLKLLPDPYPVFVAYLIAMPSGTATGYALDRLGRRMGEDPRQTRRDLRIAGLALATPMIWMAVLYTWGGLAGAGLSLTDPNVLGLAYDASLLVVPSLVMGTGIGLLLQAVSEGFSVRTRAAPG